jgi:hypothetical protein
MKSIFYIAILSTVIFLSFGCTKKATSGSSKDEPKIANIDLSHWKVTIPTAGENGKVIEVEPPALLDYASITALKPFMYNDSTDGSIVFHAYPSSTTKNTKYSRSELREQMVPGDNNKNWTFKDGGYMRGVLSVADISKDEKGKYHRVIIMQIHGRLTNAQKELSGQDDNNAPPILKIYWDNGKIRVKTKVLKDKNATDEEILHEDAWGDDEGYNFPQEIGLNKKFELEVIIKDGEMEIIMNKIHRAKYKDESIERWAIFENYFKAGNYFQSRDEGSFAKVKYYELEVSH